MALTKISGSILKDPLNLGEVSIGGTLTYQDVTNVDSVGIVTARSGIDCNGDIDVDGKVLIGTTTEGHANADDLTIATSGDTGMTIRSGTTHNGRIYFSDATSGTGEYVGSLDYDHNIDSFSIITDSELRLRIDSSGRLLLGTTTVGHPNADDLTIATSGDTGITIRSGTSNNGRIYFSDATSGTGQVVGSLDYDHNDNKFSIFTGGGERLRIDSVGRVMIGTTTEGNGNADEFTISYINHAGVTGGDQGRCGMTIRSGDNTSGVTQNGYIYFSDGTSGSNESKGVVAYEHSTDSMYLSTNQVARLRIDSNGKIGINASSPDCMLHVVKASAGTMSADGNAVLAIENNNHCVFNMMSPADKSSYIMFGDPDDINAGQIRYDHNIDELLVEVNGAEKLRITNGGLDPGTDAVTDIGNSSKRFRDLYLSSGIFLGGTGSSNELNDYEEGTYIPTVSFSGTTYTYGASNDYVLRSPHSSSNNNSISYTKIGNRVYVNFAIFWNISISARYVITLPFTFRGSAYQLCTTPAFYRVDVDGDCLGTLGAGSAAFDTYRTTKDTSNAGHALIPINAASEVYYMICYDTTQ